MYELLGDFERKKKWIDSSLVIVLHSSSSNSIFAF